MRTVAYRVDMFYSSCKDRECSIHFSTFPRGEKSWYFQGVVEQKAAEDRMGKNLDR